MTDFTGCHFGNVFIQGYGLAEASIPITILSKEDQDCIAEIPRPRLERYREERCGSLTGREGRKMSIEAYKEYIICDKENTRQAIFASIR
jgi:hypothetical protein